jgi:uncharacterized protein (DUF302 family)
VKRLLSILVTVVLWTVLASAHADELLMTRMDRAFPEAMNALQEIVQAHGYTVSRVQRVDVGLNSSGFQTAEYRLVFFGRTEEIQSLAAQHPELVPYLPLNIVIFAEGDDTVILAGDPLNLESFFKDAGLKKVFARWSKDLHAIFAELTHDRR